MQKNTFTEKNIRDFVTISYGIAIASITPLDSYIDRNFLLTDPNGEKFVFKIAHANEDEYVMKAQAKAMEYLAENNPAIKCPSVIRTLDGQSVTTIASPTGITHLARLVRYMPGAFFAEASPHSPKLLENLGRFLGSMDKTLSGFRDPALQWYLRWDLKNTADLERHTPHIRDTGLRNLVSYFLQQFKTFVVPAFPKLRTGVIHNDANDYNLLTTGSGGTEIAGIIDFGDMLHTYVICELANAAAYAVHGKDDPVETTAYMVSGYHKEYPLLEPEVDVLFHLICARLCATLLISAFQLTEDPGNEYLKISVAPARAALEKLITINPEQTADRFRQVCGMPVKTRGRSPEEILEIRERHLGKSLSVSYRKPLKIVRGAMQYLYDHTGRAYLDTVNNVCHVGHCHPRVVRAAQEQMARLNTNTRYLHDNIVEYAQRLTALLPDPLSVCFFVCTGSEANELALRMARAHTGNKDFIVLDHAYHGNTNAVIEISPYKFDGPGGSGCPPHVHITLMPDPFRGPYKASDPDAGRKYAEDVHRVLKEMETSGRKPAAFIHETIPGVAGQIVLPDHYLEQSYKYVRDAGGVCIADEVQVGFGRVGTHMWAFETQNVVPDIVTMGKPIGNGHPLAAVVTISEIADSFNNGMEYFNTFGGNPVSCAVGLAVLDVIRDEKLMENALTVGEHFKTGLKSLMKKHPLIGDIRGMGLFLGIELVTDRETLEPAEEQAHTIAERMKEEGILVSVDGPLYNVLKIKPPLVFTAANADRYVSTLDAVSDELAG
jgi:4-aminobutyrate aminotransferase-like enzyme/Ser/Thr protein kinase RdoA (MazF antagonist)